MKLLVSGDWHIKLGQKNVPVEWAKNRYSAFFDRMHALEKTVDINIITGDVFDRMPSIEELELYFAYIQGVAVKTFIIPGNHESVKKNTTFLTNLKRITNVLNPLVHIIDDFATIDGIDFIPYNKLKEYHPQDIDFHSDILVTHCRGEIPPHVKPEVPLELFERWKVVLAGDLHSYANSQRNILYSGSPMSTSFHRSPVDNGVIVFDTQDLTHEWVSLGLPQLLRKTIQAGDEMPATDYDHTIYEVEGDMAQLSGVENHTLLDKKVAKRSTDVALILEPDMTMAQELSEYLQYIQQLNEESLQAVLQEFRASEALIGVNL
jgi:DNA repair exonuclease SbcCD nuclease subunit